MLQGPSHLPPHPKQLVLLCHGYGADGYDLENAFSSLYSFFPETAFFFPNAPTSLPFGGYEWFHLNDYNPTSLPSKEYLDTLLERAQEAKKSLIQYLDFLMNKYEIEPKNCMLGGFSQGGLCALYTALTAPYLLAGAMGFSSVPLIFEKILPLSKISQNPPILLTHGTDDPVIPLSGFNLMLSEFKKANLSITSFTIPHLQHGLNSFCLEQAQKFMKIHFNKK